MIQINDISKVFRTSEVETVALNHVNLEVKEGEFVAIKVVMVTHSQHDAGFAHRTVHLFDGSVVANAVNGL